MPFLVEQRIELARETFPSQDPKGLNTLHSNLQTLNFETGNKIMIEDQSSITFLILENNVFLLLSKQKPEFTSQKTYFEAYRQWLGLTDGSGTVYRHLVYRFTTVFENGNPLVLICSFHQKFWYYFTQVQCLVFKRIFMISFYQVFS